MADAPPNMPREVFAGEGAVAEPSHALGCVPWARGALSIPNWGVPLSDPGTFCPLCPAVPKRLPVLVVCCIGEDPRTVGPNPVVFNDGTDDAEVPKRPLLLPCGGRFFVLPKTLVVAGWLAGGAVRKTEAFSDGCTVGRKIELEGWEEPPNRDTFCGVADGAFPPNSDDAVGCCADWVPLKGSAVVVFTFPNAPGCVGCVLLPVPKILVVVGIAAPKSPVVGADLDAAAKSPVPPDTEEAPDAPNAFVVPTGLPFCVFEPPNKLEVPLAWPEPNSPLLLPFPNIMFLI